jgi:hypothetical protein
LELTIEQQQINYDDTEKRYQELLEQINSLQNENQHFIEQIQQYEITMIQKDDLVKNQQDLTQQIEQRYIELEQKHNEQHALMIKVFSLSNIQRINFELFFLVINTFSSERK